MYHSTLKRFKNQSPKMTKFWHFAIFSALLLPMDSQPAHATIVWDWCCQKSGDSKFPLALPEPKGNSPQEAEFYDILKQDLEKMGLFTIIDPQTYTESPESPIQLGAFSFDDWKGVPALALAKTSLEMQNNKLRSEIWVYDIHNQSQLGAKAFSVESSKVHLLAHKVANEILLNVAQRQGPFNTQFTLVNDKTGNKQIYVMDFDGRNMHPISNIATINLQPQWSPDRQKIAFTSNLYGNNQVYIAKGNKIQRLTTRPELTTGVAWHPNSSSILTSISILDNPDVYQIDVNTGTIVNRLTSTKGADFGAVYSPDGSKIAFVSDRFGSPQIFLMNSNGSDVHRVSYIPNAVENTDPVFSPDGTQIAFVARTKGSYDIYVTDLSGQLNTPITNDQFNNEDPTWSPDGNYIAYASNRTGSYHIWMSSVDGSHQTQLSKGPGNFTNPDWSSSFPW